jgi:hypothetical protein
MTPSHHIKPFWMLTAIVVLTQLLLVQAMAASGALHKRCHDHAGEVDHECAVTLMLSGGYNTVVPDIVPVDAEKPLPPDPVAMASIHAPVPHHLIGGVLAHAPPRGP